VGNPAYLNISLISIAFTHKKRVFYICNFGSYIGATIFDSKRLDMCYSWVEAFIWQIIINSQGWEHK
jgi:hypothetical protein